MGKMIDAIDLRSLGAVNGIISTLKKREGRKRCRKNTSPAWDKRCWPLFQEGKNGIQAALALGYKHRNQTVEASLQRFKKHNGMALRGKQILPKPVQEERLDEIMTPLYRKLTTLFEHISLAEVMKEFGPLQRRPLFEFMETLCDGVGVEE